MMTMPRVSKCRKGCYGEDGLIEGRGNENSGELYLCEVECWFVGQHRRFHDIPKFRAKFGLPAESALPQNIASPLSGTVCRGSRRCVGQQRRPQAG
jgi:hypothetical protein